jgi:FkbM family methyltransferase
VALDFHADFAWRGENFRFYVGDPFDPIHRCFLKRRFFEPDELAFVETWVKLAAAIVEVGAHVGNHVVYYARFMRPRKITVLEPNPQAVALLRRNLAANDVADADLSLLGIGASDISANYDFVRASSANRGAGRLVRAADGKVKCAPLDDLVCGQVDFIRIDVEGMELAVLAGAKRVIAGSRPKIMIEVSMPEIPRVEAWMALNHYAVKRRFDHEPAANFMLEPAGE